MPMRTNDQKRAAFALRFIQCNRNKEDASRLSTLVMKTPLQVLQHGLGQSLAFLIADNGPVTGSDMKPSGRFYKELETWLCGEKEPDKPCRIYRDGESDLIKQLMEGNRSQYMQAQREAIALLVWMKKFAEAWLAGEASAGGS